MPVSKKSDYPKNWGEVVTQVRARAGDRCECTGECGLHRDNPGPRRCTERHDTNARWAKGKVRLTTAHLNYPGGPCACSPLCGDPEHLKSMCNRCHLRMDVVLHVTNARKTRRSKMGQELFGE